MEAPIKTKTDSEPVQKPAKKGPFLLTNLVRTGNQLSGGTTWTILQRALDTAVRKRLRLLPVSTLPQDAEDRLRWNKDLLTLLGKLPPDFEQPAGKLDAVAESTSELLRRFRFWLLLLLCNCKQ